jgi:phosphopantothenoylcysteine synthetase/decarboxylase
MKLLISSGPTKEPIDKVRYISNISSGETGRALANYFHEKSFDVISLYGKGSAKPEKVNRAIEFETFESLNSLMQKTLKTEKFDIVIHLAAVSDFSVKAVFKGKIESKEDIFYLPLKKNFKILDRIKSYSKSDGIPYVVGFKLTDHPSKESWLRAVQDVYDRGQVDLMVHNDYSDFNNEKNQHQFRIVNQDGRLIECPTVLSLAEQLAYVFRRL